MDQTPDFYKALQENKRPQASLKIAYTVLVFYSVADKDAAGLGHYRPRDLRTYNLIRMTLIPIDTQ